MGFCEQCGASLPEGALFCEQCGAKVQAAPAFADQNYAAADDDLEVTSYMFDRNGEFEFDADSEDETVLLVQYSPAKLVRLSNQKEGDVDKDQLVVGKSSQADFYLGGNKTISRQHAVITRKDGFYFLRDNNSLNGTYVNDQRIEPGQEVVLKDGDIIRLSDEELRFEMK